MRWLVTIADVKVMCKEKIFLNLICEQKDTFISFDLIETFIKPGG